MNYIDAAMADSRPDTGPRFVSLEPIHCAALGLGDELVLSNSRGATTGARLVAERQRWLSDPPAWWTAAGAAASTSTIPPRA